jgi:uncharacterized protein YbbC (DUF1343 family)
MTVVRTGLERWVTDAEDRQSDERIGLLCNPASVARNLTHARTLINEKVGNRLVALFSPQHGFFAEKQDNMIESAHITDPILGIPIYSLYGETRVPTKEMFDAIDTLIIDLQDAGTRVYTFIYTMSHCMEAARLYGKKIVVLDRPNPISGAFVEGNCLSPDCSSFVGRYGIPMRHGLTIGELALFFNNYCRIKCALSVIPMEGWKREMHFSDTGLPWIAPSPNLPTPTSALVYPGQVLWEGTNVSEGRGTTQPFEFLGAPFLDPQKILPLLGKQALSGTYLRPITFEPTSNKWANQPCGGFQIHVTDRDRFRPYALTLKLLQSILRLYPDNFEWKQPPYEYEYQRMPIDLLIGSKDLRRRLENLDDLDELTHSWQEELEDFVRISREFHLYD